MVKKPWTIEDFFGLDAAANIKAYYGVDSRSELRRLHTNSGSTTAACTTCFQHDALGYSVYGYDLLNDPLLFWVYTDRGYDDHSCVRAVHAGANITVIQCM